MYFQKKPMNWIKVMSGSKKGLMLFIPLRNFNTARNNSIIILIIICV